MLKVLFAPGVLEQMEEEIEPAELQSLLDELAAMAADDSIMEHSSPVDLDELAIEDPEVYEILMQRISALEDKSTAAQSRLH